MMETEGPATIVGRLERGPYYEDDFLIGRLHVVESGTTTAHVVRGYMPDAMFGEQHELTGAWVEHPKYGDQLEIESWRVIVPTKADAIARYLVKSVKWVGEAIAARIVELYGDDALVVLRDDPIRAGREVDGLNEVKAHEIAASLREAAEVIEARIEVQFLLAGHRVRAKTIEQILKKWKTQAPLRIRQNPYDLIEFEGISFPTADAIAVNRVGYPKDGEFRQLAAAKYALQQIADSEGNTLAERMTVVSKVQVLIGVRPSETALDSHVFVHHPPAEGKDEHRDRLQLKVYHDHETAVASRMRLLCGPDDWPRQPSGAGLWDDQRDALKTVCSHRLSILDGLPGTGKSFVVGHLLDEWEPAEVLCLAPTGKAAKRLSELVPARLQPRCMTMHRALQWIVGDDKPQKDEREPLEANLIVIDEFSMVDAELGAHLFRAIDPESRVLIVGDPHQLSPVRAGCVLRDFIRYGLPRASLTEIKRNAGALVRGIHSVAAGKEPEWSERFSFVGDSHNLRFIHCAEDDIYPMIYRVFDRMRAIGIDPMWDCQVMTPVNERGDFSRERLNEVLAPKLLEGGWEHEFRLGEKVIQTRNQRVPALGGGRGDEDAGEVQVVNGDLGKVVDYRIETARNGAKRRWHIVQHWWPDRIVKYEFNDSGLVPAYALTVHKMQGSSAPWVVIPLHRSQGTQVVSRNWIYTAMSRAERGCIFIGDIAMFDIALPRVETDWRSTRLVERMREAQVPVA